MRYDLSPRTAAATVRSGRTTKPTPITSTKFGASPGDPTLQTANKLLHQGGIFGAATGIYLTTERSATTEELLSFTATEGDSFSTPRSADLFVYDLATRKTTRVTNFSGEFAGMLSVSPDAQQIVFERVGVRRPRGRTYGPRPVGGGPRRKRSAAPCGERACSGLESVDFTFPHRQGARQTSLLHALTRSKKRTSTRHGARHALIQASSVRLSSEAAS